MKIKILICIAVLFFLFQTPVSAHLVGQAPFFEVNGKYSNFYPVPTTSLNDFSLAQDLAPENYLVNQPIAFTLDVAKLPVPPEIIKISKFSWEFDDGTKATGLTNTHTFTKIGSHMLSIYVNDGTTPEPQLLESVLLNILPNKKYVLPKASLTIDGLSKPNAGNNEFHLPMHQNVTLDATNSTAPSSKLVSYFWDLGDGNFQTGNQISYTYDQNTRLAFVVLRVKDANGFIADTYTALRNDTGIVLPTPTPKTSFWATNKLLFILIGTSVIVLGGITGIFITKGSPKN